MSKQKSLKKRTSSQNFLKKQLLILQDFTIECVIMKRVNDTYSAKFKIIFWNFIIIKHYYNTHYMDHISLYINKLLLCFMN